MLALVGNKMTKPLKDSRHSISESEVSHDFSVESVSFIHYSFVHSFIKTA